MSLSVTFDSNLWERVIHPHVFTKPAEAHAQLAAVQNALKSGKIKGFICESIATMEAVKQKERADFLTNQPIRPRVIHTDNSEMSTIVMAAPDQSGRPPLMPVLRDRLEDAIELGLRLIRVPIYSELSLPDSYFAEEPSEFIARYGPVAHQIEARGVGRGLLHSFGRELAMREGGSFVYSIGALPPVKNLTAADKDKISKMVAEAADGDAVAAHIAMRNDLFATGDFGKSAPFSSILDAPNREWLKQNYDVKFVTLSELVGKLAP